MPTFSPQLILRAQRIFEKRSGAPVSAEQAGMILERLAQLGNVALRIFEVEQKGGGDHE